MSDTRRRESGSSFDTTGGGVETAPDDVQARAGGGFDPTPYLRQLRGRGGNGEYLDVKWRLLWLRKEHPDAEILTELVQYEPQLAIFKATVTLPTGGKATGYGSETANDFADFVEKAETKAIGLLRHTMTDHVGVVRDREGLTRALGVIAMLEEGARTPRMTNMLAAARLIAAAALDREESRGAHFRADHPEPDPAWARRSYITGARADLISVTARGGTMPAMAD